MALTVEVTQSDGTVRKRTTAIGCDVLTLFPIDGATTHMTPNERHEIKMRGTGRAGWHRRSTYLIRKRVAQARQPVGEVEQEQRDEYTADPTNAYAMVRRTERIVNAAYGVPVRSGDPYAGEVLKACHAFYAHYRSRAMLADDGQWRRQLGALASAYRAAAAIVTERMLGQVVEKPRAPRHMPTSRSVSLSSAEPYVCDVCKNMNND